MTRDPLPTSLAELLEQKGMFEGKYRMVRRLGAGSFASVIHGRHEAMDRDVALKVLRPDVFEEHPEVGERFLTEGRLASRLTSPHTVMVFDFGETDEGLPYMVLEYVEGRSLEYAIDKYGGLGLTRSIRIAMQILESLAEAHEHNIIHRDLKPANVMIGQGMKRQQEGVHIKVLDFGVAKRVDDDGADDGVDEDGRRSTQFIGTPRYMSPEQILGREVRPASDLYSLGLMLFEMCTGNDSIPSQSVARVAQTHLSKAPLDLDGIEAMPRVLQKIVRTATARAPEDRYREAAEMRQALQDAIERGKKKNRRARTAPAAPDSDEASTDAEPRTSDVFSGDGYVEPPDEEEIARSTSPGSSKSTRPTTPSSGGASRPPSSTGGRSGRSRPRDDRETSTSGGGGELELDMESVHRQQRDVARQNPHGTSREEFAQKANSGDAAALRWGGSILAVMIAGFVGFVIVGGALSGMATPMRSGLGLLPVGLALMWAIFSQTAFPDTARRVMIPWANRSVTMVIVSLVALVLTTPDQAAYSLREDSLWYLEMAPEALRMDWLVWLTNGICDGAAWLLEHSARLIPWSG